MDPDDSTHTSSPRSSGGPTRTSSLWVAVVGFLILLVLLSVFLLQNGESVEVAFLGTRVRLPLAVAMLLSALGGGVLVATAAIARVLQLRRSTQRLRKQPPG